MNDVHVQPERGAGEGLAACLHQVQSHADKVDVIVDTPNSGVALAVNQADYMAATIGGDRSPAETRENLDV